MLSQHGSYKQKLMEFKAFQGQIFQLNFQGPITNMQGNHDQNLDNF